VIRLARKVGALFVAAVTAIAAGLIVNAVVTVVFGTPRAWWAVAVIALDLAVVGVAGAWAYTSMVDGPLISRRARSGRGGG
jgi:hypothetical protein